MTTKIPVELSSTPGIVDGSNATAITIDSSENSTFAGNVKSPRYILDGTDSATTRYIFTDNTNTGDGRLIIQSGGGSGGYGGAINLYSHAHASKPGDVVAGISSGSSGSFRVNTTGIDTGSDVFIVKANGNVGIGTTSPAQKLEILDTSTAKTRFAYSSAIYGEIGRKSDGNYEFSSYENGANLIFGTSTTNGATTERMRITSAGNITLGSGANVGTAGTIQMNVGSTSSGGGIQLFAPDNAAHSINFGDAYSTSAIYAGAIEYNHASNYMRFFTSATEKMRIDSSGIVGIGLTTPSDNNTKCLYLKGYENVMSIRNLSTTSAGERVSIDILDHNGTRRGYVSVDTSGTLFSTSSDYRLKNVIEPVQNGIERINKLKPVKFEWKETGKEEEGFIAHEVDEIFKDAVGGEKDAVHEDGSIDGQTMDYGRITPLLVKAIQEQQEQIEQLKTEIQTLKGE